MADLGDDDFADEVPDESQDTKQQASEPERNNMELVDSSLEITDVEQVATLHSSEKLLNMIKVNFAFPLSCVLMNSFPLTCLTHR